MSALSTCAQRQTAVSGPTKEKDWEWEWEWEQMEELTLLAELRKMGSAAAQMYHRWEETGGIIINCVDCLTPVDTFGTPAGDYAKLADSLKRLSQELCGR
ncbi:hypothetical protein EDC04DRAFT_3143345 [Pisolithus marmoratus]|nr:hypothetical protein EDC04DRAFT_3143345 [Pisolithus marmoratus]